MSSPVSVEGGRVLCGVLESLGITHVFGLPGTQSVPLFEALRRSGLEVVLPTSELSAAFMAGAYFRAAHRPAALVTIPGPGFTFALSGMAEARLDSAALLHVTFAMPEGPGSRFRQQVIPQRALAEELAKAVIRIHRIEDVEPGLRMAFATAVSGEPGPVVVELSAMEQEQRLQPAVDRLAAASGRDSLQRVWERLAAAQRPLFFCGQGCLGSASAVARLADRIGAPVLTTPSARGLLPEDHPLAMAFDSCRGEVETANRLLADADLVLVLGARLGHNGTAGHSLRFDPSRTCQVDAAADNIGAVYPVSLAAVASVEEFLAAAPAGNPGRGRWDEADLSLCRERMRRPAKPPPEPRICGLDPEVFFTGLRAALPREAMLVTDTGQHQVMTRRYFDVLAPGGLLMPTDFQSMGFGLPAAIASALASPGRPVVALVGDGSLAINGTELATARALGLSLPVIVFADGYLNQIRLQQQSDFGAESAVRLAALDPGVLAESAGVEHRVLGADLEGDLSWALSLGAPALLVAPVADSGRMFRKRAAARTREAVSGALGPGLRRWVRRLRGGGKPGQR